MGRNKDTNKPTDPPVETGQVPALDKPTTDPPVAGPPAAGASSEDNETGGNDPDESPAPAPTRKPSGKTGSVKGPGAKDGPQVGTFAKPNTPCFDWEKKGNKFEPILAKEGTMYDVEKKGVRILLTTGGRQIYCCSVDDYIKKFGPLPVDRAVYEHFYPQACK